MNRVCLIVTAARSKLLNGNCLSYDSGMEKQRIFCDILH
jgi:hypothetical protein